MKAATKKDRIRKLSARYPRVIEWSDEDRCYIGSAPPLVGQCCHGDTEVEVAWQLAAIVDDLVADVIDGKMVAPTLPENRTCSGRFLVRIPPDLHRRVVLQAMARGESLNQFVAEQLAHT
ncbi:MAG: type II toxin-antitoxin system HicB family antitoxin [Opitutaceae bacterium]|jgi:predicted HicB family RNase H-like nuclease|nr:type II toxin-antitoxin system HicB family antitoxin [Opitutaceae bacterium]